MARGTAGLLGGLLAVLLGGTAVGTPRLRVEQLFSAGRRPVRVGDAPAGVGCTDAAACGACHAEIAAEWRSSMHAAAWTDPVFQGAYAVEPLGLCRNCHAPTVTGGAPRGLAADDGVTCSVCHVRDAQVLGVGRRAVGPSPHPVMALRGLGESRFCSGCHQFNFTAGTRPDGAVVETDEPMQDTHREWLLSAAGSDGTHCQDCHMAWTPDPRGGHRSHRFPGGRDLALLRSAVDITVRAHPRGEDTAVVATITPRALGHSFPTGDLFRRVEVTAEWEGTAASTRRVGMAREFVEVTVHDARGAPVLVRRQTQDSRIAAAGLGPPRTLTLTLPGHPAGGRLRWTLDHLLMPTARATRQGVSETHNRMTVYSGTVTVTPTEPP